MAIGNVKVTSHVNEVIEAKNGAIARALEAIGIQAEGDVAELAPVDTGRLRDSITHEVDESEEAVYVGTNVEYAAYQEYGTSKMKPHPFLKPGIMNNLETYKSIAKQFLS
jgi:HK97 gp10 family phage protein